MVNDPIGTETNEPIQKLRENTAGDRQQNESSTSAITEPIQKKQRLEQIAGPEKVEDFPGKSLDLLIKQESTMNESVNSSATISRENQRTCAICNKAGASFVCAAKCGLEAHIECIHPDTIFTLSGMHTCEGISTWITDLILSWSNLWKLCHLSAESVVT